MRKTNIVLTSTAIAMIMGTASTAWAGNGGPHLYAPTIYLGGHHEYGYDPICAVFDHYGNSYEVSGWSLQVAHSTEVDSWGNVNAVCSGKEPWLVNHYYDKKALHFDADNTNWKECTVIDGYDEVQTGTWKQVLTNTGNFTLTCHYKPNDVD